MAMKSVNLTASLLALAISACLAGCATNQTKESVAEHNQSANVIKDELLAAHNGKLEILSTEASLPVQQKDAQGQWLAYSPQKNPYLFNKTQVNKGSVLLFLEAQKAWRAEDFTTVEQKLDVIIKNDQQLSGPWVMKARLVLRDQQYSKAEEYLKKALSLNANNVNAYTLLSQVQRLQGNYFNAQNTLAKALMLWPDFPEAHYNLAMLYDAYLNKEVEAQQHLEAYMFLEKDVDPQDFAWLQNLAQRTGVSDSDIGKKTSPSRFLQQAATE